MALLLPNNTYFKIDIDGNYTIYKNKTARNRIKRSSSPEKIIQKYDEIIKSIYSQERNYYDYAGMTAELHIWETELASYMTDLKNHTLGNEYPLIPQYFPDVSKTIPDVIETGRLGLADRYNTLEEIYNCIKDHEILGPKDEIQDC